MSIQMKGEESAAPILPLADSFATLPLITLRPESAADEILLFNLYADTRADELAGFLWDPPTCNAFLTMQFKAQRQGYQSMFPHAAFSIILVRGQPIGRIVVDRTDSEIRLVDICLLAPFRGHGIGRQLLVGLCAEAAAERKPLRLHVLKNRRAGRFYERLGFVRTDDTGVYEQLEWRGQS